MESTLSRRYPRIIDSLGEKNPQLFREIKGRLKQKNVIIVSLASIIGQTLLYLYFTNLLPVEGVNSYSRYCTGSDGDDYYYHSWGNCQTDFAGNLQVIKELWWLDLFTTMSVIGIFILLVTGSYMLIADISKENSRKTLNFLRLTPQSALTIMGGKIMGVPSLVYLFGLWAIPLHVVAGWNANIPLHLILAFYGVLAVSCFFFYTASIFFSLITSNLGGFQAWLGSLIIFFFCLGINAQVLQTGTLTLTSFDWLTLFYPGTFLAYLVKGTFLAPNTIGYLSLEGLNNLNWYGNSWWQNPLSGFVFISANYALWSYWLWQGIKRSFHNPHHTAISKYHSYLITACFVVCNLGFTLQKLPLKNSDYDIQLFSFLLFNFTYFLVMGVLLTPSRQVLLDWSQFRHQNSSHNLFHDLILEDNSPMVGAIVLNVIIVTLYVIPAFLIFPMMQDKLLMISGLILGGLMVIFYGTIYQIFSTLKTRKRHVIATATVISLIFSPLLPILVYGVNASSSTMAMAWLFSPFSLHVINEVSGMFVMGSFLTQVLLIIGFNYQLTRVVNRLGFSETKAMLNS